VDDSVRTAPSTSRSASTEMAPGRSTSTGSVVQSTTVDSTPASVCPPCRMQSIRPPRSSCTASQVVGLGRPDRLADGAGTGVSQAARNLWVSGRPGIRTPTVSSPAVTTDGSSGCLGRMIVSGPGRKRSRSGSAAAGIVAAT
jgi:hypothetical protein